jgi:predicted adenylyl cyclase CyaB
MSAPFTPHIQAMSHYEVEIKSLLGSKENADALLSRMRILDPGVALVSKNAQLNHYFEGGDVKKLVASVQPLFDDEELTKLDTMVQKGKDFSVRTREKDGQVFLVLKASVDSGTSANTVSRLEFEEPVLLTLTELDELVQKAGFSYQAKWSRSREEYAYKGANVCLDKNAGYGYLAEFEKVIPNEDALASTRSEIEAMMSELGVSELPQDRLARMFDFYNKNWQEYYGTEKVFVVE